MTAPEFNQLRSDLYQKAMAACPNARAQDLEAMLRLLQPQQGEHILGIGEGNGYFVPHIAKAVGAGNYVATDPSEHQLSEVKAKYPDVQVKVCGAEQIDQKQVYDKVWSFGAFHHCPQQDEAMRRIYAALKPQGKLVICDVFQGTRLAEHFDGPVAKYCCTGHDVKFLSDIYARTIAEKAGFRDVQIVDLALQWHFDSKVKLGEFIYGLHAMTGVKGYDLQDIFERVYEGCAYMLGTRVVDGVIWLNWPMKALVAYK